MNKYKKTLLLSFLTLLLWGLSNPTFAQPGNRPGQSNENREGMQQRHDKVKEARQAFLAERMKLTTTEAAAFFPLYEKFDTEIRQARRRRFKQFQGIDEENPTEAEAQLYIQATLDAEADKIDILRRAAAAYLEVIPATKLIKMEPAERAFRRELVKRFRNGPGKRGDREKR